MNRQVWRRHQHRHALWLCAETSARAGLSPQPDFADGVRTDAFCCGSSAHDAGDATFLPRERGRAGRRGASFSVKVGRQLDVLVVGDAHRGLLANKIQALRWALSPHSAITLSSRPITPLREFDQTTATK